MAEATFTVVDPSGLHARPAARFVQVASRFAARVAVRTGTVEADAKSLIGILGLAIRPGSEIRLVAEGADEAEALAALTTELTPYVVPVVPGEDGAVTGSRAPATGALELSPD